MKLGKLLVCGLIAVAFSSGCKQASIDRCVETNEYVQTCGLAANPDVDSLTDEEMARIEDSCEDSVNLSIDTGCKSECGDANKCTNNVVNADDTTCENVSAQLASECGAELQACETCRGAASTDGGE